MYRRFRTQIICALTSLLCSNALLAQPSTHPLKIVVLGSSTSAGYKVTADSAYVNLLRNYLVSNVSSAFTVINFAVSGYNTYKMQPSWYVPPDGQTIDYTRNIDAAIAHNPDAILINFPSNDARDGLSIEAQQNNFLRVAAKANSANIPVWVTTTQPRNLGVIARLSLITMRIWIETQFGNRTIDFWTGLANENGSLKAEYDCGDGTHLTGTGHALIFNRVVNSTLLNYVSATVLPIHLEKFTATRQGKEVVLHWKASGIDVNTYFNIQQCSGKSITDWHTITSIPAAASRPGEIGSFSYVHQPHFSKSGNMMYRIAWTEPDGTTRYSNTQLVQWEDEISNLSVRSFNHNIVITNYESMPVEFVIYDSGGRLIKKGNCPQGNFALELQSRGVFIVTMYRSDGQKYSRKLLVY